MNRRAKAKIWTYHIIGFVMLFSIGLATVYGGYVVGIAIGIAGVGFVTVGQKQWDIEKLIWEKKVAEWVSTYLEKKNDDLNRQLASPYPLSPEMLREIQGHAEYSAKSDLISRLDGNIPSACSYCSEDDIAKSDRLWTVFRQLKREITEKGAPKVMEYTKSWNLKVEHETNKRTEVEEYDNVVSAAHALVELMTDDERKDLFDEYEIKGER